MNKSLAEAELDKVLKYCNSVGVDFVAYVLIKPHTLSEKDAIEDAYRTAMHIFEKAADNDVYARIAFEPVFVVKGVTEFLFNDGRFSPPNLWSIVEILNKTYTSSSNSTKNNNKTIARLH